jgi:transposase
VLAADGHGTNAIMQQTGKSKPCVWRWQERYVEEGVDGLLRDKTRPPGKKPLSAAVKRKVLSKTAGEMPPNATHWSVRSMAKVAGISHTSVQRICAEAGLKPHLVRRFKISNDPQFEEKVTDVVGLYLNPPDRALVQSAFPHRAGCRARFFLRSARGFVSGARIEKHN